MKLSKKSSLYVLAKLGWMSREDTNLCTVFWCSLWGLCMAAGISIVGGLFSALIIGLPLANIIGYFATGVWVPEQGAVIGMIIDSVLLGLFTIGAIGMAYDTYIHSDPVREAKREERRIERQQNPGLLRTAYRSWKEKTCVLIQFEGSR